jgi:eukaryotic-like serine/threonine-protein kinase
VDSSKVDTRADLYAPGATLYFLLAGHPPYPTDDIERKLTAKQEEDPHPLHLLRPDVPQELSAVVHRLLARDPAGRFAAPATAAAALLPWAAPGPDFPARLFRLSSDSTEHDRRLPARPCSHDAMPDTLPIVKPTGRRADAEPLTTSIRRPAVAEVPAAELVSTPGPVATDPTALDHVPLTQIAPVLVVAKEAAPREVGRSLSCLVGWFAAALTLAGGLGALIACAGR